MPWLRAFVADADAYTSSSKPRSRPAKRESPSRSESQRPARLVVAMAPELTIGFVRPSALRSTAAMELNGRPVPLTPTRSRTASGPSCSQTSAKTNGLDTLMIVNSRSASPAV